MAESQSQLKTVYNTEYLCTFRLLWDILDQMEEYNSVSTEIQIDIKQKEEMENLAYQQDLLQIFYLPEFNELELNNRMEHLYDTFKNNCMILDILHDMMKDYFLRSDEEWEAANEEAKKKTKEEEENQKRFAFFSLFSFDFLDFTHPCICDLINTNTISQWNVDRLFRHIEMNKINQNRNS